MEQRFHHHHHHHHNHHQEHRTRFAPPPPQSHHHLPPPPTLPPPPPLPYRTIHTPPPPPPPPYNPNPPLPHHSPQFPFYPLEQQRRSTGNHPPLDFDRESHHHHYCHRPPPPYPIMRYESENFNGRLNSEISNNRDTVIYSRATNDDSYHRHVTATSTSNLDYKERDEVFNRIENRRFLNDRKVQNFSSPSHSPSFELVNDEIDASLKREYHGREFSRTPPNSSRLNSGECNRVREFSRTPPNSSRLNSRECNRVREFSRTPPNSSRSNSRECNRGREFSRTPPKKQIQKKSALLRIQTVKPNHRNRDIEQLHYVSDSNNNFFRGGNKDQHGGYAKGEERKKDSPVELDISFESNTLVAKAIVNTAPSMSGVAPVSDKLSSGGENLNDNAKSNRHEKNEVVVSAQGSGTGTRKLVSKIVKKKKIVKKVAKKGSVNTSANADGGMVQADSVIFSSSNAVSGTDKTETFLEEKNNVFDKVAAPDDQENVLTEDEKGGLSLLSSGCRSKECKNDEDCDIGKDFRFELGGSISNSRFCVSSIVEKNSGSDCVDVCNSVHDLLSVANIDKATKSLDRSTSEINHMGFGNKPLCQSESSLSPGKYIDVGCSGNRNLVDVGNEMNYNVDSADITNTHNSADDSVYGINSNDLTSSEEKITISDSGNNDIDGGEVYCEKMTPAIDRCSMSEENSDSSIPLPSNVMIASSSLGDTRIQDGQDCVQHTSVLKQGSDDGSSSLEESVIVHQFSIMKDAEKQLSPGEVCISTETCDIDETFPNSNISLGFEVKDTVKIEKRDVRTRLDFLSLNLDDISFTPVSHSNNADRDSTILLKDLGPSEVLDHSNQGLDFYSLSNQVGGTDLHGKRAFSEAEFCVANNDSDDVNKISPVSKRKKVTAKLSDCIFPGASFESVDTNRETKSSELLELLHSDMVSTQCEDPSVLNIESSVLEYKQKDNSTTVLPTRNTQTDILVIGNINGEKKDSQAEINCHYRDVVQNSPRDDMVSNDLNAKADSVGHENLISCPANGDGVNISDSNHELIEDLPEALSDMYSQGMTSELPDRMSTEFRGIDDDEDICGDDENPNSVSMVEHGSDSDTFSLSKHHTEKTMKSDYLSRSSDPITRNITPEPTQVYSQVTPLGLNSSRSELNGSKNQPGGAILKASQGHSFALPKSTTKTPASSIHASKSRTWHRTDKNNNNPPASLSRVTLSAGIVPPKRPILEWKKNFQNTSYIRKGNSLVRNPTPVSALPLISSTSLTRRPTAVFTIPQNSSADPLPLGLGEIPKGTKPESRADLTDKPIYSKIKVSNTNLQSQGTPLLPIDTRSEENISSPLLEPPSSGFCENASDHRKFIETIDSPATCEDVLKQYETPENQTGPFSNGECQAEANDGNISSLNSKKIVYIKPKTNQLVATSSSCDVIGSTDEKGQTTFSDRYYKRRKNQLVRTTFENHVNETVAMANNIVNSDSQRASKVLCNRRFNKRRSHKVAGILGKYSRASLVWTLGSKNSPGNDRDSWHYQKVLPPLFPWKRTTYLRSFIDSSASSFNSGSLSAVGKKLLLMRKRDTLYTRSTRGFSLWKSKVLGVGGSSLKWSKSIEKHSKKANEEATLAVAAVERKKREKKDPACVAPQTKRDRIFRVGSVRYKMDPSRRTLQRISDDESLSSGSIRSSLASKRSYIPKRLVIGDDEYVRIGNGNQLVRDPKRRIRKLANEKVRWSLHTARQRLARKHKYCQFFTRFGKCNKDGGKCPYIHDPSKIAVCTKFLNDLCSTPNCKLTHKVIPERMPDCSYFLQGLCSNVNCPYRHVNVNPKASICEGFLKGYCADGDECQKKHRYVCPSFEATGTCTQGTKCKLHHPKKQSKGKKRKRSGDQNNNRGRYFGSSPVDVSEPGITVAPSHPQQSEEREEELTDYISLDVYEEAADTVDQSTFCDNNNMDLQLDTSDELIKPVFLLKKFASQSQSQSRSLQA